MEDSEETKPKIPREGWAEAFKQAIAEDDEDELIGVDIQNDFDEEEW